MKKDIKEQKIELITEMLGGVRMLTNKTQSNIDLNDLKRLGIGLDDSTLKTSKKQISESAKKKQAMSIIQQNLNESLELAKEFGFENLYNQLNRY